MTLLMVRFISAKVMPHGGGIVRAHRHRRVIKCREKIGPDIVDLCGGLAHGLNGVLDVGAIQLSEPLLHCVRWQALASDPQGGGGAAQHVHHQLQKALHIVIGVGSPQVLKVNIRFDFLPQFVSVHPHGNAGGLEGRDGWMDQGG